MHSVLWVIKVLVLVLVLVHCSWPSPLCALYQLVEICSTFHLRLSRISSMVHTSAVTQKELVSCLGTNTKNRRITNRENKPGTERHIDQPGTTRRLDRVDRCLLSPCNGNGWNVQF